ncbi:MULTISPECIES: molybdate ABC transporter permease subunit [Nitratiruptor]|uniref:Molybdenum transport system permease n=1 Tax=Nitratiruptor tergarcus DSM 16512 TaxID=1069081 RepID=A0A1W1WRJ4_9BACT|nr:MULTISPECIES: molybdate ABC transporter permease subunit [Nitratiruptor]BCD61333.1 molybdate transport system permease protein [Nitratiruptor sp. YY08-13]BCD65266.1 molybdate transport system permease protein [Nitratiruptor sp. YY08-26]SMC08835.1 molybdate transport system permease protein [Nitratiruptor tergarcus DSM 16512]
MIDWIPFILSFKLATITTTMLFAIGLPIAWWLASTKNRFKPIIEAFVSMPIVLPPTVLGFYILWAFSPGTFLGKFFSSIGIEPLFSFPGLVIASLLYSFPFMVQPLQSGFEGVPKSLIEASFIAGKNRMQTLMHVILPNMKPSILTALIITFAHTIGEFGVVLMVGGSIPGKTKVASIAIYEYVEILDYKSAHIYSAIMVALSFTVLLAVYIFNQKSKKVQL